MRAWILHSAPAGCSTPFFEQCQRTKIVLADTLDAPAIRVPACGDGDCCARVRVAVKDMLQFSKDLLQLSIDNRKNLLIILSLNPSHTATDPRFTLEGIILR